jgi:hypothetical protein
VMDVRRRAAQSVRCRRHCPGAVLDRKRARHPPTRSRRRYPSAPNHVEGSSAGPCRQTPACSLAEKWTPISVRLNWAARTPNQFTRRHLQSKPRTQQQLRLPNTPRRPRSQRIWSECRGEDRHTLLCLCHPNELACKSARKWEPAPEALEAGSKLGFPMGARPAPVSPLPQTKLSVTDPWVLALSGGGPFRR